ncbi:hypothetical protein F5887DRAFT_1072480 [Amanita rubescens]|nr:hypothetical protein F5887DRAFT_1072480 [Amanita rubescens]
MTFWYWEQVFQKLLTQFRNIFGIKLELASVFAVVGVGLAQVNAGLINQHGFAS